MAMTKADYEEAGRAFVRGTGPEFPNLRIGGWAHTAYKVGEMKERRRMSSAALHYEPRGIDKSRSIEITSIQMAVDAACTWPPGARHHALRLVDDLATEKSPDRRERLLRALNRMAKRHNPSPTHQNPAQRTEGH